MSNEKIYPVQRDQAERCLIDKKMYNEMYKSSIDNPSGFWSEQANNFLDWLVKWDKVTSFDFNTGSAKWFANGKLNVSVNCIDRHLATEAEKTAIIWEGDSPQDSKNISYQEILKSLKKRDKSDVNRKISPLKKTKDSILLNTSNLSIRRCFLKIKKIIDRELVI